MSDEVATFRAKAWALGSRLDLRRLSDDNLVAVGPNTYGLGAGRFLAVFRYGAVVCFGLSEEEQAERIARLTSFVSDSFERPEVEELEIRVDPNGRERFERNGTLVLNSVEVSKVQVVAHVLAKSTVLSHYESQVTKAFTRVEKRSRVPDRGTNRRRARHLVEEIRAALAIRVQTVGRVETTEKPELLWEEPHLEHLYELIAGEFELRDRDVALTRKLEIVSESAATSLELIQTSQSLRVEWYIVILIVVEIVLIVYDLFAH